jgi:type IV pilus assembly protein PilB
VAEVLMVDRKVAQAIHLGVSRSELMDAIVQAGFEPLIKNARELVVNGVSTVEELLRVAYDAD